MRLPKAEGDWVPVWLVTPWSEGTAISCDGLNYKAVVFGSGLGVVSCKI